MVRGLGMMEALGPAIISFTLSFPSRPPKVFCEAQPQHERMALLARFLQACAAVHSYNCLRCSSRSDRPSRPPPLPPGQAVDAARRASQHDQVPGRAILPHRDFASTGAEGGRGG